MFSFSGQIFHGGINLGLLRDIFFRGCHVIGLVIVTAVAESANGLGVVCVAQFSGVRILLKLWFVRSEFSQKFNVVCTAGLGSWSSFGDVIS